MNRYAQSRIHNLAYEVATVLDGSMWNGRRRKVYTANAAGTTGCGDHGEVAERRAGNADDGGGGEARGDVGVGGVRSGTRPFAPVGAQADGPFLRWLWDVAGRIPKHALRLPFGVFLAIGGLAVGGGAGSNSPGDLDGATEVSKTEGRSRAGPATYCWETSFDWRSIW